MFHRGIEFLKEIFVSCFFKENKKCSRGREIYLFTIGEYFVQLREGLRAAGFSEVAKGSEAAMVRVFG